LLTSPAVSPIDFGAPATWHPHATPLTVDGVRVGDAPAPAAELPSATPEARAFARWANLIRAHGGEVNPSGRASVLGLRTRDGVTRSFEDKLVVLSPDGRVREFAASTRPSGTTSRNGGVAELAVGTYTVHPHGPHYGRPSWEVRTRSGSSRVPVYRDLNGDAAYSPEEKRALRTGSGILFHVPNPSTHDQAPTSIGCINVRARDWDAFIRALGGPTKSFAFTLIESER
jgi:hypothetical protein